MDRPTVRRLVRGLGATLYGQATIIIIQLVGVPILLHYWGTQLYGEWLILFAVPAYLSMTDLGFSQSAGNDMTARVARGDRNGALGVFQSLNLLIFFVTALGLFIVTAVAATLPLGSWLHLSELSNRDVRWIVWLLAAEVLIKLTDGINHAGYRATGDYALHVSIYYSTLLAQSVIIWVLAALGQGPLTASAAFFAIRALVTPSVAFLLTSRHSWLKFGFEQAHFATLRKLLRPALANTGIPLALALNVQGMVLLVGAVLGPLAVVTFSTLRTLTRLALQLVFAVSNAAEPELAAAFGSGNYTLVRTIYQQTLRAGFWLSSLAALGLALTGNWILQLWTNGRVAMDAALFPWLLASAVASVLWWGSLTLLKAVNQHLGAALLCAASAAATLALAYVMLHTTRSLSTAGLSLLFMDGAMAIYTLRAAGRLVGSPPKASMLSALDPTPLLRLLSTKGHALT